MTKPRFVFSLLFKITLLVVAAMTAVIGLVAPFNPAENAISQR